MSILPLIRAAAGALAAGIRSTLGLLASLPRRNLDRVWYWLSPTPGYVPFVVLRQAALGTHDTHGALRRLVVLSSTV